MSNAVYPVLPGLAFGVSRVPMAPPVQVRTTPSQREFRARDATLPRYLYKLKYEFLRSDAFWAELQALAGFFNARGGSFDSFLFTDPDDNSIATQLFGTGNGSATAFQLVRSFGGFAEPVSDVAYIDNIAMNGGLGGYGSFELDSNADGLADGMQLFVGGAGDGARTYTKGIGTFGYEPHGSKSQFFQITAVGNSQDSGIGFLVNVPVLPSTTYTLGFYGMSNAGGKVYGVARLYKADQVTQTGSDQTTAFLSSGIPARKTVTFTTPSDCAYAQLMVRGITAVNEYIYVDAITLVRGASDATITSTQIPLLQGPDYSVGATGIVTMARAPANGAALTWTGSFYRRCRFALDQLDAEKFMQDLWQAGRVDLVSTAN